MERLARLSLDHPVAMSLVLGLVTLGLGAGLLRLDTDVGYRSLLGRAHPVVAGFDAFLERFDGGFPLAAVYDCGQTPRCDSVFDPDALRMAASVAEALAGEPSIRRVETPATAALLVPEDFGEVAVRRLAPEGEPATDREALAERALHDSTWPRQLVNADGTVGAIVLEVESSESRDNAAAYAALDAALAPHEARGYRFHRVGGPVEFVVAGGELQTDTARMVPLMVALVAAVFVVLFRSPRLAAAALLPVGASVLWTFGAIGWLGWPQNSVTQALPPLLLVIGVGDVIHLLARLASDAAERPDHTRRALLLEATQEVGWPCVLTSLTTAAGFASFATSGLQSFVRFGLAASFGVMVALALTFSLLPILALHLPLVHEPAHAATTRWNRVLRAVVDASQRRARLVLGTAALLGVVFAFGAASLRVEASFEDLYGAGSRVVRWAHYVGDHLRRPDTLEVELRPPSGTRATDPEALRVVEAVSDSLAGIDGLGPARSVVPLVSLLNQLASDDEPFWYRLPGREADVADIFDALRERDPSALARWVDAEGPRFRVSLESEKAPQDEMRRMLRESRQRLDAALPAGWTAELTGPLFIVHAMVDEIQSTQLWSFAVAAGVVLALVGAFLRSLRLALLALVPTVLPVIVTLGAMGWWGAPLDVGSAMVAAVVLGIAVDDCIHVLSIYRENRRAALSRSEAMRAAVLRVGRAVVTTSIALALGFFTLTLSSWSTIAHFGALAGVAILGALVAVVAVLPAWMAVASRE